MTSQERLEIYLDMLEGYRFRWFGHGYTRGGFCSYLRFRYGLTVRGYIHLDDLVELDSLNPKRMYKDSSFWFKPGRVGPRRRLLRKAIRMCKENIQADRGIDQGSFC